MASAWTDEDIKILTEQYPLKGANIPELLIRHSRTSIFQQASKMNIARDTNWRSKVSSLQQSRLGVSEKMTNGLMATVIAYRNSMDIDIKFENGIIVKHKQWYAFDDGTVACPGVKQAAKGRSKVAEGETKKMQCGMHATIIKKYDNSKIDVQFADGTIVKKRDVSSYLRGHIANPNISLKTYRLKTGHRKPVYCYGVEYKSITAFSHHFGLAPSTVAQKLNNGLSPEEIATRVGFSTKEKVYDHKGHAFDSKMAMAEYWKIPYQTFYRREKKYKWPLEKNLTTPVGQSLNARNLALQTERIGVPIQVNNGLHIIVDRFLGNCRDCEAHFKEDPAVKLTTSYPVIKKGEVSHPVLHTGKKTVGFYGFDASFLSRSETKVYYKCECRICGLKDVLTPQQMIEHWKEAHAC